MSANDKSSPEHYLTFEDISCWRDQEDEKIVEKAEVCWSSGFVPGKIGGRII